MPIHNGYFYANNLTPFNHHSHLITVFARCAVGVIIPTFSLWLYITKILCSIFKVLKSCLLKIFNNQNLNIAIYLYMLQVGSQKYRKIF